MPAPSCEHPSPPQHTAGGPHQRVPYVPSPTSRHPLAPRPTPARLAALQSLGFLFDGDEAEWVRWYRCLLAFKATTGHASPMPLVTGADMYLINWWVGERCRNCQC